MDDFFTSAEAAAWGGFMSAHGQLSKRLEENLRRNAGLSHAEYEVLLRLFRQQDGRLRIQDLAEHSVLTRSGTSRLVDRLEGTGLVTRAGAEEDRRGAYAVLTEAGRDHFIQTAQRHTTLVRESFLSHFSTEELELLDSYWARLEPDG